MAESLLTSDEILSAVDGVLVLGEGELFFSNVQTDSRNVVEGTLFVPLIGEVQDGHKYIPQAVEKGASVVFIAKKNYEADSQFFVEQWKKKTSVSYIAVDNTMTALQKAAGRYVEKFPGLLKIAVTGSSGKTTTKEILASIMRERYNVITNEGNFNSETGLPLSVFRIRKEHECGIFEMGMNRENEIGEISEVLKANCALITNIGTAHVGILGSRDSIAKEKSKVFDWFNSDGIGVIPFDDDYTSFLSEKNRGKTVLYGQNTERVVFVKNLGLGGTSFTVDGEEVVLPLPGKYNYKNALGAVSLAFEFGLTGKEIASGIKKMPSMFGRCQVLHGKYTVICDCYNANPDSMEKAVELVSSLDDGCSKVLVLGDMLELGAESVASHRKTGESVADSSASVVFLVGKEIKAAYEIVEKSGKKVFWFEEKSDGTIEKIASLIESECAEGSVILVKGSRGIALERLVNKIGGGEGL